jgi:hypothetical protein
VFSIVESTQSLDQEASVLVELEAFVSDFTFTLFTDSTIVSVVVSIVASVFALI